MASQTSILGAAGEYFVLSSLLRRGYIAALAPQGVPNTDIVVSDLNGDRLCAIQVKTRREIGSDGGWHMSEKHEKISSKNLFYAFVDFGRSENDPPKSFILPSKKVCAVLSTSHKAWLARPGRNGQPHHDTKMRRFLPNYRIIFGETKNPYPEGWLNKYKENWDQLSLVPQKQLLKSDTSD
ncbi:MAG TPA: hypothetical protein VGC26_06195 [Afipia sp.]